jgi:hypothetical protein
MAAVLQKINGVKVGVACSHFLGNKRLEWKISWHF